MLAERLGCPVAIHEDYGTPSSAIEAMIEALTASELFVGHTNHAPGLSGATEPTFVGMIAPGYASARG
jgi:hypothetical protein